MNDADHDATHAVNHDTLGARILHAAALISLITLILLGIAVETWLAPLKPGGSLLVLKVVPLLLALPGIWRRQVYTLQWSSMLILLYLAEGLISATSGKHNAATWGMMEIALATVYFAAVLAYLRPYKRAARAARSHAQTSE